jgi:hypothetical protein
MFNQCKRCRYKIECLRYAKAHEIVFTKDGPRYRYLVNQRRKKSIKIEATTFHCRTKTCVFHDWEERWNCGLAKFKRNSLKFVQCCPVREGWTKLTKLLCMDRYFHLHAKEFAKYQREWRNRNREYRANIIKMYRNRKKLGKHNKNG